jgi:pimeloyl-ACP methyl ester carboxylesterase
MADWQSEFVDVDGIRTHYLEAGEGPTVVLLHSGEFGGAAEISWEFTIPALAKAGYRAIAPDWLGFGRTDKIYDFGAPRERPIAHMRRFVEVMGIKEADFIGNSMGGSMLVQIASRPPVRLPIRSMVLGPGGGGTPATEARKVLLAYDGSEEAMRALLAAMLYDKKFSKDDAYVARRQEFARMPGAFECTSASRLRAPFREASPYFGGADQTPYESVAVPTLIIAGAEDPLREPGFAPKLAQRIKGAEVIVFERCGHCPNIEMPDEFNRAAIAFLDRVNGKKR